MARKRENKLLLGSQAWALVIGVTYKEHEGKMATIAYVSRAFINAERNYSVQEKECHGIVFAIQKFRHYVLGNNFTVRIMTDHNSLQYLGQKSYFYRLPKFEGGILNMALRGTGTLRQL
eukprot:SAG11_NODE_1696_length_4435_cov_3.645295_6_plen_119_part_00